MKDRFPWLVVAVAAVLGGAVTVLATLWLSAAVAAGAAAVVATLAGVLAGRGTEALARRDDKKGLNSSGWLGRLPRVRDLDNPVALGVHPAAAVSSEPALARTPAFVTRDLVAALTQAMSTERFVLVVGESTAGKSRVAYEVMRSLLPDHRLVEPAGVDGVRSALHAMITKRRAVLWLDDLERFLGRTGLTGTAVRTVLDAPGGDRHIVATIRSEEYAKYFGWLRAEPGNLGGDALRAGWDVLRLATPLNLPRAWSPSELARAREQRDDPRLSDALEHADRFGVAEYLAAGPQLLADWQHAWAPGHHPRAAALVLVAVAARRVGIHRPLPLTVLDRAHEHYLRERGGELLRPEPLADAVAWATTPLHATSSLLLPAGGDTYLAFDYLIDAIDKELIPAGVFDAMIDYATSDELSEIAEVAFGMLRFDQAEAAYRRADTGAGREPAFNWYLLVRNRHGADAALAFARDQDAHQQRSLEPTHPDALAARDLVSWGLADTGDLDAAVRLATEVLHDAERALGADHERTLHIRRSLANHIARTGDTRRGAELHAEVAARSASVLGPHHPLTVLCRQMAAEYTGQAGDPQGAVDQLRAVVADETGAGARGSETGRYVLAEWLMKTGSYAEALGIWEQVVADERSRYGGHHISTLGARINAANCVGRTGDHAGAIELIDSVIADAAQLNAPRSRWVLAFRRLRAYWIGVAGDPVSAARQLQELVTISAEERGFNDFYTQNHRLSLARWTGESGDIPEAIRQLEQLIADAEHAAVDHTELPKFRAELEKWRTTLAQLSS